MAQSIPWGTDGPISLPQAMETQDTDKVDMEGFVFTPDGLRVSATKADREDLLISGYRPEGVTPQ